MGVARRQAKSQTSHIASHVLGCTTVTKSPPSVPMFFLLMCDILTDPVIRVSFLALLSTNAPTVQVESCIKIDTLNADTQSQEARHGQKIPRVEIRFSGRIKPWMPFFQITNLLAA